MSDVSPRQGAPMNLADWAIPLPEGDGLMWTDPREIHQVSVHLVHPVQSVHGLRLEYWGSKWPEQRLPKDREPGGGSVGWWELGNWYLGGWRPMDCDIAVDGNRMRFTPAPLTRTEYLDLADYNVPFRYTLKLRLVSGVPLPQITAWEVHSDSVWTPFEARLCWSHEPSTGSTPSTPLIQTHNARFMGLTPAGSDAAVLQALIASNADPNTFDRSVVTVRLGDRAFSFRPDDLAQSPIFVPQAGAAIVEPNDARSYDEIADQTSGRTLYDRIAEMPEQTWPNSWGGMVAKKSDIIFPLGLDGGRQRFKLYADGSVEYRLRNEFLLRRPGADTDPVRADGEPIHVTFGLPDRPVERTIQDGYLPLCISEWERDGITYTQTALVTELGGTRASGSMPLGDASAVCMVRIAATNAGDEARSASVHVCIKDCALELDSRGIVTYAGLLRAHVVVSGSPQMLDGSARWNWSLEPGESRSIVVKLPFVTSMADADVGRLEALEFDRELNEVAGYWRAKVSSGMRLVTPEPMLSDFHRAHLSHLLVNCEREPDSNRRFARVGSFDYAAYGNESCMMVTDLDRRGLHGEAEDCLEAWLHYQGTVELPGDFSSKEGVLYGAGGYEHGGYNQHHGWILWCLAEHFRFTRDRAWLEHATPGILAGAQWIMRERARTADRTDLAKDLLPAGSLEDIMDWWPWLSTNCYTWRGLDAAAWALEQAGHSEAAHVRSDADAYRSALLSSFRSAAVNAPVVRLRDGTWVSKIPTTPYRRGRFFGWICETLEGAIHLLITRAIDPKSDEALRILKDYEDNLYLSNQWGYTVADFEKQWFGLGGMSMQSCLLFDVEPYLYRDDVKHALRAAFNAIAVGYFPDVRMITEHALPDMGDWAGDHYKSSDEANAAGWLRYLFVREEGNELLLGQAVPREWLAPGKTCGVERAATHFGPMSLTYHGAAGGVTAEIKAPVRNLPERIRLRFRMPDGGAPRAVTVNGRPWADVDGEWVLLPGSVGRAKIEAIQ